MGETGPKNTKFQRLRPGPRIERGSGTHLNFEESIVNKSRAPRTTGLAKLAIPVNLSLKAQKSTACTKNLVEKLLRLAPESNEVPAHRGSRGPRSATNSGRAQRYGSCKILPANLDPKAQTGTAWARWQNKKKIPITLNHNPTPNQTGFPH
jgi:hypothetical protein